MSQQQQPSSNQKSKFDNASYDNSLKTVSLSTFLFTIIVVALISFVSGTRSEQLMAQVGGLFGISVESGEIDLSSAEAVYSKLKANYDGELDKAALIDGASRGLVEAAGDDYTVFMDAKEAEEFSDQLDGRISGIGAEIGIRNDVPTVLRLIDNSPAKKSGLKKFDSIIGVNEKSTFGSTASETAQLIRGEEGTTVKLAILRGEEELEFNITRASVTDSSVSAEIDGEVGVLTIRRFDSDTGELARREAEKFVAAGLNSVILDLRDNGGGHLDQAQAVAGIWLDDKVVVSERRNSKETGQLLSTGRPILSELKTIVLVNENSASASEIVAGALKDHGAAELVGETTFGKGTVQQLFNLPGGQKLKITVARWYTPNGLNISGKGIKPDHEVELTADDVNANKDPQLQAAKDRL